jgi:bifunctional DNase/RNase
VVHKQVVVVGVGSVTEVTTLPVAVTVIVGVTVTVGLSGMTIKVAGIPLTFGVFVKVVMEAGAVIVRVVVTFVKTGGGVK